MKDTPANQVAQYYSKLGSRLGYLLVMGRSQHFGYYDDAHTTEKAAQTNYHERFAHLLDVKADMRVLDAGCGQGVVGCYLAKSHKVRVNGVTVVPHEVTRANQRAAKMGVSSRVVFELSDYAKLPYPEDTFDRVYTTESLSHAPDLQAVVNELYRVLKSGGKLVCAEYEFHHGKLDLKQRLAADYVKRHAAILGIDQFGPGAFVAALKNAGFEQVTEADWTKHMMPSFARLRKLGRPFSAVTAALGIEHRFVNVSAAKMYADGVEAGVFKYKAYTARKPN